MSVGCLRTISFNALKFIASAHSVVYVRYVDLSITSGYFPITDYCLVSKTETHIVLYAVQTETLYKIRVILGV